MTGKDGRWRPIESFTIDERLWLGEDLPKAGGLEEFGHVSARPLDLAVCYGDWGMYSNTHGTRM